MKRLLPISIILLILSMNHFALALTVTTHEKYYWVTPKNENDIHNAIRVASYLGGDAVATHQGRYDYTMYTRAHKNKCYLSKLTINFTSTILLPKLDTIYKNYSQQTIEAFNIVYKDYDLHENTHRKIHMKHLQKTVNQLRRIDQVTTTFKSCSELKKHIRQEFKKTSEIIRQENAEFDCLEYGIEYGYHKCEKYDKRPIPEIKKSQSSSLTLGGKDDVKSYKGTEKPDEQECDGQLIEPFKGKFYCVPTGSYSE